MREASSLTSYELGRDKVDAAHLLYTNGWTVKQIAKVMDISETLCKMFLGKWTGRRVA